MVPSRRREIEGAGHQSTETEPRSGKTYAQEPCECAVECKATNGGCSRQESLEPANLITAIESVPVGIKTPGKKG